MDVQPCPASNAHKLRVVQQLLWDVISQHLYPAERDEIRRALGGLLLDENEGLFAEATALADILGDVQLDTAALLARQAICSNPQRNMVEAEIRLLIDRLHCAAASTPYGSAAVRERDPESLLPRSGTRDKAVLDYVTTVSQLAETGGRPPSAALPPRPPTALSASAATSRPGTTSTRPPTALSASASGSLYRPHTALSAPGGGGGAGCSRPSSAASSSAASSATRYADAPSVVAGVAEQLTLATIDAVRDTLRAALQDERAALLEDVEYLQGLLDMEADMQTRAAAPPPSLAELRDYSSRLAAVVADEEGRVEHEMRVSAMFAAAEEQTGRPGRLRGMVDASRRPPSSASSSQSQSSSVAAAAGPAARRAGSGGEAGGPGGGAQTLVVHGSGEEAAQRRGRPSEPSGAVAPSAPADSVPRGSALAAVRRPGSGGSSAAAGPGAAPPPQPSVLASPGGALRSQAPLLSVRASPGPVGGADAGSTAGSAVLDLRLKGDAGSSPLLASSSGRLRPASPGRLLQAGAASGPTPGSPAVSRAGAAHQPHIPASPPQPHARREPSPARPAGSSSLLSPSAGPSAGPLGVPRSGSGSGSAGTTGLKPLLHRSNSVGLSTPERSSTVAGGPAGAAGASSAGAVSAARASPGGGSAARRLTGRSSNGTEGAAGSGGATSSGGTGAAGGSTVPASPGSAVAARLGSAAAAAASTAAAATAATAVQPRALLGGKQSMVEVLEAEVDAVRGGVAAILERYNIRPVTPSTPSATAATAAADTAVGADAGAEGARGGS